MCEICLEVSVITNPDLLERTSENCLNKSYDLTILSNRLPIDRIDEVASETKWRRAPGGLVSALEPVMGDNNGVWIGWDGSEKKQSGVFEVSGLELVALSLDSNDIENYYEGFSNSTLWPLYHDVISTPEFNRDWWNSYVQVNKKFAMIAAEYAAVNGVVWVHDYQLQLVPAMLRKMRADIKIGFFNHIPFPCVEIFAQLPWRRQILEGLLGADVVGFQRTNDANNFLDSVRKFLGVVSQSSVLQVPKQESMVGHRCKVGAFPISIDTKHFEQLSEDPQIQARSKEIRAELGNPKIVILGIDRLDYTKGIRHRLQAFGELLEEGSLCVEDVTLVQVANPSRERVESYIQLRSEVEVMVGRINGSFDTLGNNAVRYLHNTYPVEEMVALYLAADIFLVTALRDGMNLIAKEYVASRKNDGGVLVLSEFTGAAEQLSQALLINPHDIEQVKEAIMQAVAMSEQEANRRMRIMHSGLEVFDVARWSNSFLAELAQQ